MTSFSTPELLRGLHLAMDRVLVQAQQGEATRWLAAYARLFAAYDDACSNQEVRYVP